MYIKEAGLIVPMGEGELAMEQHRLEGALARGPEIVPAEDLEHLKPRVRREFVPILGRSAAGLPSLETDGDQPVGWADRFVRVSGHGSWGAFLKAYFPDLPSRTARRWMAEARYFLDHGRRKTATLAVLAASGGRFDEDEAEELDADDLADPKKPAPRPREELEAELRRRNAQKTAWEKRDEAHQEENDALRRQVDRLAKARDPDAIPYMNPIREAMVKAVLSAGRAVVVLREAETEDLVTELREGAIASLNSRLVTAAQDAANEIYKVFHKAFPGKPWKGPEPTDED